MRTSRHDVVPRAVQLALTRALLQLGFDPTIACDAAHPAAPAHCLEAPGRGRTENQIWEFGAGVKISLVIFETRFSTV